MSRKLTYTKGDLTDNLDDIYRMFTETFNKLDNVEIGFDSVTGTPFLKIRTGKGIFQTKIGTFGDSGGGTGESNLKAVGEGDLVEPTAANKLTKAKSHTLPSQYSVWKYDFKLAHDSDATGDLVSIPDDFMLDKIVVKVTTAFDNSATIKFDDDSGTIAPASRFNLADDTYAYEVPIWQVYTAADTLAYTITGSPTTGTMRVIVLGEELTK